MNAAALRRWSETHAWVWSYLATFVLILVMIPIVKAHGIAQTLQVALQFASFYVMVGLGQMLVIALGNGNIDLSIPGIVTLAAFVGLSASETGLGMAAGVAAAIGVGVGTGLVNAVLVRLVRIPPMIATLSSGFAFQSMAIAFSRGASRPPSPLLASVSTERLLGIPALAILPLAAGILAALAMRRSRLGRTILAAGQNIRAARLAGLAVGRAAIIVYVASGVFAALTGLFLAASVGGASLDMGQDYLLFSIAVVVLGGTAIAGGQASAAGVWGASLLLVVSVTTLNVLGVGAGVRFLVTGLIIVSVLALTGASDA